MKAAFYAASVLAALFGVGLVFVAAHRWMNGAPCPDPLVALAAAGLEFLLAWGLCRDARAA